MDGVSCVVRNIVVRSRALNSQGMHNSRKLGLLCASVTELSISPADRRLIQLLHRRRAALVAAAHA